ncbi:MAG: alpha/beta hydrolase [Pseudohongiellaceae bacterium]
MNRLQKVGVAFLAVLFLLAAVLILVARNQALSLVYSPLEERDPLRLNPADFSLQYQDVITQSSDGNTLHAWYVPSTNGAGIILQHGFKSDREELLEEAAMLANRGYGVLLTSIRAHDINEGELIAFGLKEMPDIDAWVKFLQAQEDITSIGMLGNSLGGTLSIQYAAENGAIKALVVHSAFSSMRDTINTSVRYFTDLPPFPFATLIRFWAEQEIKGDIDDIDAKKWIGKISPRPILIIHSLSDVAISPESGELLLEAAAEPKELWQVEGVRHASFDTELAEAFEDKVGKFFDQYLLGVE